MSRTYRKPKSRYETEVAFVNDELNWLYRRYCRYGELTTQIKVRKTHAEYQRDLAAANARYEADCRAVRKQFWYCHTNPGSVMYDCYLRALPEKYKYYVSKYRYENAPIDVDKEIAEAKRKYAKLTRDGYWNETGCNTAYKTLSKETVRNAVRQLERRILKDEDWDYLPYPDTYLGKKHIWDVW